jgi:hypothetical protein
MESSVIDQLRLQEGRLFQNEKVLALFLDVKAVIHERIVKGLDKASEIDDDALEQSLKVLSPDGIKDYHCKALYDCVKIVAKLLWPTQLLLVAKPKLMTLMNGIVRRIEANDSIKQTYTSLDPIKQDYIVREAFRRTLVNDCLIVFDQEQNDAEMEAPEADQANALGSDLDLGNEIGPDDSASQFVTEKLAEKPRGARSTLGAGSVLNDELPGSVAPGSVAPGSVAHGSVAPGCAVDQSSVMPKVITVSRTLDASSVVSRNTSLSNTNSVMRRPLNVRTVHIKPENE